MTKLEKLLDDFQQRRISVGNAGNPYVVDEYWDRYYDGQCEMHA